MDARYYNGDPDNHPRLHREGPRREQPAASDYRGLPCHGCGKSMHRVYTLADVGAFCSPGCRSRATEPVQKQGAA
jgi:hypothetical protein